MELLLTLLFPIILFTLVGRTLYKLYRGTTPEPDEVGLIFRERNGGTVSVGTSGLYLHLTKPFVTLHLYEDKILLNYGGQKVELLYSDVVKVDGFHIPIFYSGVRIHHKNPNQPTFVRFWSGKSKEIKKLIEERLGVNP